MITKFSGMGRFTYPWCSVGALRAPELRYQYSIFTQTLIHGGNHERKFELRITVCLGIKKKKKKKWNCKCFELQPTFTVFRGKEAKQKLVVEDPRPQ